MGNSDETRAAEDRYRAADAAHDAGGSWDDVVEAWSDIGVAFGHPAGIPFPHPTYPVSLSKQFPFQRYQGTTTADFDDRNPAVADLALLLWYDAGCPDGMADAHWRLAERWLKSDLLYYLMWRRRRRFRAYFLWEAAGRPTGRDREFWEEAADDFHGATFDNLTCRQEVNAWGSGSGLWSVKVIRDARTGKSNAQLQVYTAADTMKLYESLLSVSTLWSMRAELKAQAKLRSLLPWDHFRQYVLTGMFVEQSKRSRLVYLFRRSRPTVVCRERATGSETLCCLCSHPVGFYQGTWAGALPPTDDVIAHLLLMRHDEWRLWKTSEQHRVADHLAGLF